MNEKVSGVGRRRSVLDEQIVQAVVGMAICQREIQPALYLSAELPRLSFNLPDDRRSEVPPPNAWANSGSTKSSDPLWRRLQCFKTKLPCCAYTRTRPVRRHVRRGHQLGLLNVMGAGPAGRIGYAAASRLDGIGRRAIGDMVSSAVASS